MINADEIKAIALSIDIDYGDYLSKKELWDLFEIKRLEAYSDKLDPTQLRELFEDANWSFWQAIDLFRTHLRIDRNMVLVPDRKSKSYRVIRPHEHVDIAIGNLRKSINKAMDKAKDVLDATRVDMLDHTERFKLQSAQQRVTQLDEMFSKQTLKEKLLACDD